MDEPHLAIFVQQVRYFAIYPDGRTLEVRGEDARHYEDKWLRQDGVIVATQISYVRAPVVGSLYYEEP